MKVLFVMMIFIATLGLIKSEVSGHFLQENHSNEMLLMRNIENDVE